ncbi:MAG: hypothetical protein LUD07_00465 [Clostridiales bacterium]|nr:hypothetical protein [Clostridiales bacterium]
MTILEITESIGSGEKTPEEKLKILRRIRGDLMEELHGKQQLVDQVDYLIYQLKTEQNKTQKTTYQA